MHLPAPVSPHVVIFESDLAIRRLMTEVLLAEGYRVTPLSTTATSVALVRELAPAAVLLDLGYRDQPTCWQFLQALRGDPGTGAIPVVLTTTHCSLIRTSSAIWTADLLVVEKPFPLVQLTAAIATAIQARSPAGDAGAAASYDVAHLVAVPPGAAASAIA